MKLGTLLLANAAIGLSQLEAALRNQVIYGGRLGTNLVELGFLDLETLSATLAELSGVPVATPARLDAAARELLDAVGVEEAHRLRAIAMAREPSGAVAVALVEPGDQAALAALADRLGGPIAPYVVPEMRALYYLERHYGTPRRARFHRTAPAEAGPGTRPGDERRTTLPAGGIVVPPPLTLVPRRRGESQAPPARLVPTAVSFAAACERVDTARDRDQIAEALVDYARGRFDALLVLLVRDGNAVGWRGYVAPPAALTRPIDVLSLPLGVVSALQAAHDAGRTFQGPPPSPARPTESALWQALGAEPAPVEVLVVPIQVNQRTVNLIYAHTLGGAPPRALVSELDDLAGRVQTSYLRLIRQTRGV